MIEIVFWIFFALGVGSACAFLGTLLLIGWPKDKASERIRKLKPLSDSYWSATQRDAEQAKRDVLILSELRARDKRRRTGR